MSGLQEWIYKLEEGEWGKKLKVVAGLLLILGLTVLYDLRCYRNFSSPEAMEMAQVARNLSQGKGFTTQYVRPADLFLLRERLPPRTAFHLGELTPDMATPPLYPALLAGWMKLLPFDYQIKNPNQANFTRYEPEVYIMVLNQILFFGVGLLLFFLARRLFDESVAWGSVLVLVGTDLLWRYSMSGLSTMLLVLLFVGLVWRLLMLEQACRSESVPGRGRLVWWAMGIGALVALGGLTRYAYAWLLFPVLIYLAVVASPHRILVVLVALVTFGAVLSPWLARNYRVSGRLYGTASFAVSQSTLSLPEDALERSLYPKRALSQVGFSDYARKLSMNAREILSSELPRLGGNWVSGFFLVGLLLPFHNPSLGRLRWFLLGCLVLLGGVQALGRTYLSELSPEVNTENLLIVVVPLVFVYGAGLFFILLDQSRIPFRQGREMAVIGFVAVLTLPLILVLLPPRSQPVAYPPYYPPAIQKTSGWLTEKELMLSDLPWAVAWYGRRQCLLLTSNFKADVFLVNDEIKPIKGLLLTPRTVEGRLGSQMIKNRDGWGRFVVESLVLRDIPSGFPLNRLYADLLPDHLFFSDWERWKATSGKSRD